MERLISLSLLHVIWGELGQLALDSVKLVIIKKKKTQLWLRGCSKNKPSLIVCYLALGIVFPGSHGIFLTCVLRAAIATHQWFQTRVLHRSCAFGAPEKKSQNSLQNEAMCCWLKRVLCHAWFQSQPHVKILLHIATWTSPHKMRNFDFSIYFLATTMENVHYSLFMNCL